MIIKEIKLINHRNYDVENVKFHENTNILVGKNAQGKTNLLEAIYICARGYSFKNLNETDLINFNKEQMYLKADIISNKKKKSVEIKISKNQKKRIRINEVEISNLSELKSQFGVVLFAPEEILIIKDSPSIRRKFIDDIISNNDITYKKYSINYNKIRSQKNELLKNKNVKYFDQLLDSYNKSIIQYGSLIAIYRYKYIEILKKFARDFHRSLTNEKEDLEIKYITNFTNELYLIEEIEKNYENILKNNKQQEINRGQSIYGPHKDELIFYINGKDVKTYGSQGQQRTTMLSLKLAEAKLIEKLTKTKPILLWDDVFSELDNTRASLLVEKSKMYQNIITTNSLINIDSNNLIGNIYKISDGKVTRKE